MRGVCPCSCCLYQKPLFRLERQYLRVIRYHTLWIWISYLRVDWLGCMSTWMENGFPASLRMYQLRMRAVLIFNLWITISLIGLVWWCIWDMVFALLAESISCWLTSVYVHEGDFPTSTSEWWERHLWAGPHHWHSYPAFSSSFEGVIRLQTITGCQSVFLVLYLQWRPSTFTTWCWSWWGLFFACRGFFFLCLSVIVFVYSSSCYFIASRSYV